MGVRFAKFTRFAIMLNWIMLLPYYMVGASDALLVAISVPEMKFPYASLIVAAVLIVSVEFERDDFKHVTSIIHSYDHSHKNRHRYNFNHFMVSRKSRSYLIFVSYVVFEREPLFHPSLTHSTYSCHLHKSDHSPNAHPVLFSHTFTHDNATLRNT